MSVPSRIRRLAVAAVAGVLLASGLAATPALADGYPTFAACDAAGRAGVAAGDWPYYTCTPYQGRWRLNPA